MIIPVLLGTGCAPQPKLLDKSSVCDGDEIMVDGERCTIVSLSVGEQ